MIKEKSYCAYSAPILQWPRLTCHRRNDRQHNQIYMYMRKTRSSKCVRESDILHCVPSHALGSSITITTPTFSVSDTKMHLPQQLKQKQHLEDTQAATTPTGRSYQVDRYIRRCPSRNPSPSGFVTETPALPHPSTTHPACHPNRGPRASHPQLQHR